MNSIELFFSKNSTQIWTIISVIIGGLITYFSTLHIESKKMKMNKRSESATNVVIPCVLCLRDTRNKLISLRNKINLSNDIYLLKEIQLLNEPLDFLNDERNYFLPKYLREQLKSYGEKFKDFYYTLNKECDEYIDKYSNYLSNKLNGYMYDNNNCIAYSSFSNSVRNKVRLMLVRNKFFSLKDTLNGVNFHLENFSPVLSLQYDYINLDESTRREINNIKYALENDFDVLENRKKSREERCALDPNYASNDFYEDEEYDARLIMSINLLNYLNSSVFDDEHELLAKGNFCSHSKFDSLLYCLDSIIDTFNDYIDSIFYNN